MFILTVPHLEDHKINLVPITPNNLFNKLKQRYRNKSSVNTYFLIRHLCNNKQ